MKHLENMNDAYGISTTLLFLGVAWIDSLEQWMRIGASGVAILAGALVVVKHILHILDRRSKKRRNSNGRDTT